MLPIPETS